MATVKLLNVPFESNYKDTVWFANVQAQRLYMDSKIVVTLTGATYQRKDNIIRVPAHIDTLYNCNYVAYQNVPYTGKIFYAFITDMEYKQDDCTLLHIQTDVLQTWMFDYSVKQSFVEREHVRDDTLGSNTIPENLEVGEFRCLNYYEDDELKDIHVVLGTTVDTTGKNVLGGNYNGIYSGVKYFSIETKQGADLINSTIKLLENEEGKVEGLQCIFIAPKFLVNDGDEVLEVNHSNTMKAYARSITPVLPTLKVKNNKCLTFPYRYILVGNNNGGSAVYHYEKFDQRGVEFSVWGALTPGCSIRLVPKFYNGVSLNNEEGLNLGKYPICNWTSDVYTNWLTQNSVNIGLNLASGVGQVAGGIVLGAVSGGVGAGIGGGMALSGASAIASQLAQIHQMSFTAPQSHGNINCGDVITASESNTFCFYQMCVKDEYLKIIDDYFQMFGYKVNRVKVPETDHRPYFWYTKTIDVNIDGAIPNKDLQEIKNCYNNGITFWRANATMNDYSVENTAPIK